MIDDFNPSKKDNKNIPSSEEMFASLFAHMPSGVAVYRATDGGNSFVFADINPAAEMIENVRKSDIIGRRVDEIFPGAYELGLIEVLRRVWKTGESEYLPKALYRDENREGWRENWIYKLQTGEVVALYNDITARVKAEEESESQKNLFKNLVANIPYAVFWKNRSSIYYGCNENFARIVGMKSPEDVFGKSDYDLPWTKSESDAIVSSDMKVMENGAPILNVEETLHQIDGREAVILMSKAPLRDTMGNVVGLLGVYNDISERKYMEKSLIETVNHWQTTFDSSRDMIVLLDENMHIVKANRACSEFLNVPIDQMVGQFCYQIFHGAKNPMELCPLAKMKKTKVDRITETIFIPDRDGWLFISVDSMRDSSGNLLGYVHLMRDVTASKKMEEEIKKSETKFKTVFENSAGAIIIFDVETGRIVECNSQAESLVGYSRKQLIGMQYAKLHPKEESEEHEKKFLDHINEDMLGDYEGQIERENGVRVSVLIRAKKMKIDDKDVAMVLLIDITDRKRAETSIQKAYNELKVAQADLVQSEKMAAIGRFSAGIAHEVKNPLAIIVGCAELLENKIPHYDIDAMDTLEKIKDSALRANSILVSLLQYARPSDLKVEIATPEELINGVLPLFEKRAEESSVSIVRDFVSEHMRVSVDKNQLHQVLFNVIKNAIEAMPEGGKLTIKTYKSIVPELSHSLPSCVVELKDTGSGISRENLAKIAEPFFSTKPRVAGTGLGLFMGKSIMDKHKGKLLVNSEPGHGTSVKVVLPILGD